MEQRVTRLLTNSLQLDILQLPSYQKYLYSLTALNLAELEQSLVNFKDEESRIDKSLIELCINEYKSFLSLNHLKINKNIIDLKQNKDKFESIIPLIQNEINNLNISNINSQINEINKLQFLRDNLNKILILLEIPDILRQLVELEYYEDAIDLRDFISNLRKHKLTLIDDLYQECKVIINIMVSKLLLNLSSNSSMHSSLRIMGYLRRLRTFTEQELKILFLKSRYKYYKNQEFEDVKLFLEFTRSFYVDLITQYTAIFTSDAILCSFFHYFLKDLFSRLSKFQFGDIQFLSATLNQLMHLGVSLSRKGFDTRLLMNDLFTEKVMELTRNYVHAVFVNLGNDLESVSNALEIAASEILGVFNQLRLLPLVSCAKLVYVLLEEEMRMLDEVLKEKREIECVSAEEEKEFSKFMNEVEQFKQNVYKHFYVIYPDYNKVFN